MKARLATLAFAMVLGGCAHHPRRVAVAPPAGPCHTDRLKVLLGRPGSAVLAAEALDLSGAREVRFAKPRQAMTMDYRDDRLTIRLNRDNRVRGFTCG